MIPSETLEPDHNFPLTPSQRPPCVQDVFTFALLSKPRTPPPYSAFTAGEAAQFIPSLMDRSFPAQFLNHTQILVTI